MKTNEIGEVEELSITWYKHRSAAAQSLARDKFTDQDVDVPESELYMPGKKHSLIFSSKEEVKKGDYLSVDIDLGDYLGKYYFQVEEFQNEVGKAVPVNQFRFLQTFSKVSQYKVLVGLKVNLVTHPEGIQAAKLDARLQ